MNRYSNKRNMSKNKVFGLIIASIIIGLIIAVAVMPLVYKNKIARLELDLSSSNNNETALSSQLNDLTEDYYELDSKLNSKTTIDNVVVKMYDALTSEEISNDTNLSLGLTYRITFDFNVKNDTDLDRVSKVEIVSSGLSVRQTDEVNFENIKYEDFSYNQSNQKVTATLKYVSESGETEAEHVSFDFFTTISGSLNININVDGVKNFEYNKTVDMI